MQGGCSYGSAKLNKHFRNVNKIAKLWNESSGIREVHGRIRLMANGEMGNQNAIQAIDSLVKTQVNPIKQFHSHFVLSDREAKRLTNAIKNYEKSIKGGSFVSQIANIMGIPHEVVKKSPVANQFMLALDSQVSFERHQIGNMKARTGRIANFIQEAYKDLAKPKWGGRLKASRAVRKIHKLQRNMASSESMRHRAAYDLAIRELLNSDDGKLINDLKTLISMDEKAFRKSSKEYNPNIVEAAKESKIALKELGVVMLHGIDRMRDAYLLKRWGTDDVKSPQIQGHTVTTNFLKRINSSKSRILRKMEDGDYYPQYIIPDLQSLKRSADNMAQLNMTDGKYNKEIEHLSNSVFSNFGIKGGADSPPQHSKEKSQLDLAYNKDPLYVINQYGYDVVGFNRQMEIQYQYAKTMRKLPKDPKVSADFIMGMKTYLDDMYTIAGRGYKDRPKWVNDWMYLLGSATVARTMGLGFTGSIRNLASISFFVTNFGPKVVYDALNLYNTQHNASIENQDNVIRDLQRVEARETGFLFGEGNTQELFTFGLLPSEGVTNVEFDPMVGKIKYSQSGMDKYIKPLASWSVNKLLVFHRLTENASRKWMFRTAFIHKYQQDMAHPEYVESRGGPRAIRDDARNFAINAVNAWAYEYAGHSKSKLIRGVPGSLDAKGNPVDQGKVFIGAASQSMNMLMHYPHSLVGTHYRLLKGAGQSIKAGMLTPTGIAESPELLYFARYAGLYAALQASSVLYNLDFNNIIENDTLEKMKEMAESIIEWDSSDKVTRGALGTWLGPLPDDIRYALEVSGIKNGNRSALEKMLLGNTDYANQYGSDRDKSLWYKIGTEPGRWYSKILPAFRDGRGWDVFRHYFNMYPKKWTKEYHDKYVEPVISKVIGRPMNKKVIGPGGKEKSLKSLATMIQIKKFEQPSNIAKFPFD